MTVEAGAAPAAATQNLAIQPGALVPPQAAPETPPPAADDAKDPPWLPARLEAARERERRAMLRDFGVEKVEDAKAQLAELKTRRDAEKSDNERLRSENADLAVKAKRVADLEAVIAVKATAEMAALTEAQRLAVEAIAGPDASAQLRAVEALRPTWAATVVAPAAKPPPPPATAPQNGAPPAPNAQGADNVLANYERLSETHPVGAAEYFLANYDAIQTAKKARG